MKSRIIAWIWQRSLRLVSTSVAFYLVALDCHAKVIVRKKFSRSQLLAFKANLPWSLIGMEACSGAHFLAAKLRDQEHEVKLIPAQFVNAMKQLGRE